jgi:hypothetical protein
MATLEAIKSGRRVNDALQDKVSIVLINLHLILPAPSSQDLDMMACRASD